MVYDYRIRVWYIIGFVFLFIGDFDEVFDVEIINMFFLLVLSFNLFNVFLSSYSYCYRIDLVIYYDDGICCYFINIECVFIG